MARELDDVAVYIRRSKEDQEDEHQRDDILDWLHRHDLQIGDVELYPEHGSGADEERSQFRQLIDDFPEISLHSVVVVRLIIHRCPRRAAPDQEESCVLQCLC